MRDFLSDYFTELFCRKTEINVQVYNFCVYVCPKYVRFSTMAHILVDSTKHKIKKIATLLQKQKINCYPTLLLTTISPNSQICAQHKHPWPCISKWTCVKTRHSSAMGKMNNNVNSAYILLDVYIQLCTIIISSLFLLCCLCMYAMPHL